MTSNESRGRQLNQRVSQIIPIDFIFIKYLNGKQNYCLSGTVAINVCPFQYLLLSTYFDRSNQWFLWYLSATILYFLLRKLCFMLNEAHTIQCNTLDFLIFSRLFAFVCRKFEQWSFDLRFSYFSIELSVRPDVNQLSSLILLGAYS